jgi:hypothetical protein
MNYDHLAWTMHHSELLLQKYGTHSALGGFQPVNEPWWNTPLPVLKDMYRKVRKLVQRYAPQALFIFHDSFRYEPKDWNDLFRDDDIENVVIDHHYYWAFESDLKEVQDMCNHAKYFAELAD